MSRLLRRLRPEDNPLRRPVDRWESTVVLVLALLFGLAGPVATVVAGLSTYDHLGSRAAVLRAERTHVTATVVQDARYAPATAGWAGGAVATVEARWTAPDGSVHTGDLVTGSGTRAGDTVRLWTDAQGRIRPEPLSPGQVLMLSGYAAVGAAAVLAVALAGAARVARVLADRRRYADWDREWLDVAPRHNRPV
jgi:hypothetical protein